MTVKEQVHELLRKAYELVEQGQWTCDGFPGASEECSAAMGELLQYVDTAVEWVDYYMDEQQN